MYLRSVIRRWKRDLGNASEKVLIFSPYLTSDTAELVLRSAPPEICEVYTLFSAEHFANGGSSIRTLRTLTKEGFPLYELPRLHAKIVLISGLCASIGSQNLTRGGTTNKEATVIMTDPKEVARLERDLKPWLASRRRITPEMISDVEALLPKLVRKFRLFQKETAAVDKRVQTEIARRHSHRLRNLQAALAGVPKARKEVVARVCQIDQASWVSFSLSNQTHSLLAKPQDDLTRWPMDDRVVRLERMTRYICIIEDTGRFGWARVGKTRITFIADGISGLTLSIGTRTCGMELSALWEKDKNSEENLRIVLSPQNSLGKLEIAAWFGIDKLSISRITPAKSSVDLVRLATWINRHKSEFSNQVIGHLLKPFHYEKNRLGSEATTFFGPIGSRFQLRIATVGEYPIIQAKNV